MNHYPHHLGDYAKDTLGFSIEQHGAYRLLMDAYYATEEPLPADDVYAIAKAVTLEHRKAVDKVLKKFQLHDGVWRHKRIEEEIAAYYARSEAGGKAAKKRWGPTDSASPPASRSHGKPHRSSTPPASDSHDIGTGSRIDSAMPASSHKPINPTPEQAASSVGYSSAGEHAAALLAALRVDERVDSSKQKSIEHVTQWVRDGVTAEQITKAIRIARLRKPHPELIGCAYLATIVGDVVAGRARDPEEPRGKAAHPEGLRRIRAREEREAKALAAAAQEPPRARERSESEEEPNARMERLRAEHREAAELTNNGQPYSSNAADLWWLDPDRVMERAVELQVQVFDGERFGDFTARVLATLGPGPHEGLIEDHDLLERIRYFAAVGPNTDAARPAS